MSHVIRNIRIPVRRSVLREASRFRSRGQASHRFQKGTRRGRLRRIDPQAPGGRSVGAARFQGQPAARPAAAGVPEKERRRRRRPGRRPDRRDRGSSRREKAPDRAGQEEAEEIRRHRAYQGVEKEGEEADAAHIVAKSRDCEGRDPRCEDRKRALPRRLPPPLRRLSAFVRDRADSPRAPATRSRIRTAFETARTSMTDAAGFLGLFADVCRLFRRPEDYVGAALAVAGALADDRVDYAEIYVSPEIFSRIGLDPGGVPRGDRRRVPRGAGDARGPLPHSPRRRPPLGPGVRRPCARPLRTPSASVDRRLRDGWRRSLAPGRRVRRGLPARAVSGPADLGRTPASGPGRSRCATSSTRCRPDRLDHGIAAAADPRLLDRLVEEGTVLCVAPTGNVRTRAVAGAAEHPLRRLLEAGVLVTLSADDPVLFGTTTRGEYRFAKTALGLDRRRAPYARVERVARGLLPARGEGAAPAGVLGSRRPGFRSRQLTGRGVSRRGSLRTGRGSAARASPSGTRARPGGGTAAENRDHSAGSWRSSSAPRAIPSTSPTGRR